jgi:surface protein
MKKLFKHLNRLVALSFIFATLGIAGCKKDVSEDPTPETKTYTVSIASTIENGTVTADKTTELSAGEKVTLTVKPASDYTLESLTVTDDSDTTVSTTADADDSTKYTFTMPESNVNVSATFTSTASTPETKTYTVTIASTIENGTVTADKTTGLKAGEKVTLTVTPASDYTLEALTVTDALSAAVSTTVDANDSTKYTFTMPESNVNVSATFTEEKPIVNPMTTEELEAQSKTIKQALKDLDVKNATAFKPSLTAPAEGTETKVINEKLNQVFWKEGTEIYYYSPDGSKISFGTDASELFYYCKKIKEIDLSGFDTSDVTNMYRLFRECQALETLDVSLFNTSNVTNMGYMFSDCRNLKSIDVSRFNTSKVTNMSNMFSDCFKLESIDLNSFKTNKVTNMNAMFASCKAIKEIDVTMFDTSKVTDMFQMFTFCESITELDVSSFDVTKVEQGNIDRMFYHCTNLRTIYAKNDAVWKNLTCNDVFTDCTALVGGNGTKYNANYKKYTYARVDGYEGKKGYFTGISMKPNDKEITPENQSKFIRGAINYFEISKARAFKPSSTAPADGIETKTVNGQLKQVIWKDKDIIYYYSPDGSKISLGNDASKLFADGGYMLREIDLSGFDTSDVTNMSQMFSNCSGLTSLNISSFDTSNVTDMSKMFSSCRSLTSLDVSSFKTDRVETMYYMFYACSKLTKLDLSNFETKKVTNMNSMFDYCEAITEIIFSNNFDVSHVTNLSHMFSRCKALKKLDVSNFKTYSATDMGWMFCDCSSLTELDISNFHVTIETKVYSLFENCSSLKTIYCSPGTDWSGIYKDTSYNGIFQGTLPTMDMFKGCTSLVGGEGTKFIDTKIREEYARFDGRNGTSGDGYFTVKK